MASIVVAGDTSGTVTLTAPATAGTTTLTLPTTNGTILTTGSSGQSIPRAALPAGSVLQVVSATKTDNQSFSLSTGTLADIADLSVSITPTSATSKILVIFTVHMGCTTTTSNPYVVLDRNGTNILLGNSVGSRTRATATAGFMASSDYTLASVSQNFLDSPATTSSVTYKLRAGGYASRTFYVNSTAVNNSEGNTGTSSITVMEVAA